MSNAEVREVSAGGGITALGEPSAQGGIAPRSGAKFKAWVTGAFEMLACCRELRGLFWSVVLLIVLRWLIRAEARRNHHHDGEAA